MKHRVGYGALCGGVIGLMCFLFRQMLGSAFAAFLLCVLLLLVSLALLASYQPEQTAAEEAPRQTAAGGTASPPTAQGAADLPAAKRRLERLQKNVAALQNAAVRKESAECVQLCSEILTAAQTDPGGEKDLANFYRHYLPMFDEMMANYQKCEAADVLPAGQTEKVTAFLDVMEDAMKKLKETIYLTDVDRLAVDMSVLETLYHSAGLLESELTPQRKEGEVHEQ